MSRTDRPHQLINPYASAEQRSGSAALPESARAAGRALLVGALGLGAMASITGTSAASTVLEEDSDTVTTVLGPEGEGDTRPQGGNGTDPQAEETSPGQERGPIGDPSDHNVSNPEAGEKLPGPDGYFGGEFDEWLDGVEVPDDLDEAISFYENVDFGDAQFGGGVFRDGEKWLPGISFDYDESGNFDWEKCLAALRCAYGAGTDEDSGPIENEADEALSPEDVDLEDSTRSEEPSEAESDARVMEDDSETAPQGEDVVPSDRPAGTDYDENGDRRNPTREQLGDTPLPADHPVFEQRRLDRSGNHGDSTGEESPGIDRPAPITDGGGNSVVPLDEVDRDDISTDADGEAVVHDDERSFDFETVMYTPEYWDRKHEETLRILDLALRQTLKDPDM